MTSQNQARLPVSSPLAKTTASDAEYKTVEKEFSQNELRQQMQQWNQEGWAVLSISQPLTQANGTIHRKVELKRAKQ